MIALLPSYLTSAQMTAEWENRLLAMERGEETIDAFMGDIVHLLDQMIAECREVPVEKAQRFSAEKSSRSSTFCSRQIFPSPFPGITAIYCFVYFINNYILCFLTHFNVLVLNSF